VGFQEKRLDLVMLSNFERSGGGMETWAAGFIPSLLQACTQLKLCVYGMVPPGRQQQTGQILLDLPAPLAARVASRYFPVIWPGIPWFFSVFFQARRHDYPEAEEAPEWVLAVGGLFELLIVLFVPRWRGSKRAIWLRTIFFNEKAKRVPRILLPLLPLLRRCEAWLLGKVDVVLANGEDIASHYGKYGLRVQVIRNGVDVQKWVLPEPRLQDPLRVAFIGRLAAAKGIREYLQMIRQLAGTSGWDSFRFSVIGEGPLAEEVRVLESQALLDFSGPVDNAELPAMLENYDICVALTLASETGGGGGTSNALLEQMSAQRVIVAWDNVIFRQLLDPDNACLVPQGDIEGLVSALLDLAGDRPAALARARRGREKMGEFSLEKQLTKFRGVLASGGGR
jgi:glycosyltransferase involved in cell wall biosynthesis